MGFSALPLGKPSGVWLIQRAGETTVVCGLQSCGINDTHLLPIVIARNEMTKQSRRVGIGWIAAPPDGGSQ